MSFKVTVQPRIPFQNPDLPSAGNGNSDMEEVNIGGGKDHDTHGELLLETHEHKIPYDDREQRTWCKKC